MADFLQGFFGTQAAGVEARNDVTVVVKNFFANRNPLATRLPYVPVERVDFIMYSHKFRPRSTTLATAISSSGTTALVVGDATFLMAGDVLQLIDTANGTEYVQIVGDPTNSTTVTIVRGVGGTTAQSTYATATTTVFLVSNARNGSAVNQTGLSTVGIPRTQYCQTYQMPVQVGGSAQTTGAEVMPGGILSPFDFNKTMQLQHLVDDIENTFYYGKAQAPSSDNTVVALSNGLKSILQTNNTTSPANASAYGSTDLIRDTLQAARSSGGEPDLLVVSTNFMSGFATWGQAIQRISAGETTFGTPITLLEAPFLHGVMIVEAPLLRPFTAIALTSSEVYVRNKRNPFWNQRGNRGDMVEGDWIAEMAIEVANEQHHSWLEGITAFSAN